ncbi:JmjC domain-containing protein [Aphelenchoides fujianensis]|nr:JmjC domain-containing protein [Aphelenchoides fujianensis]
MDWRCWRSALILFVFLLSIGSAEAKEHVSGGPHVIEDLDGGWLLPNEVPIKDDGRCTVERRDARTFTQEEFLHEFAFQRPVLIENVANEEFRRLTQKSVMLEHWNSTLVTLNSANTFSYRRVPSTFGEYVEKFLRPQDLKTLGNETLYLFGDIDPEIWKPLLERYKQPPWTVPDHDAALSFGIAGAGTGVPFHFHGPGFSETIFGKKRWFLTPYGKPPAFDPDKSTLDWFLNALPKLKEADRPLECTVKAGEIIYFPHQWWHATLNEQTSVFISTFLTPNARAVLPRNEL